MSTLPERLEGGLLIGDALGVSYEFKEPHELPPSGQIEFAPPPHYPRSHEGIPPGTWSDDGAQALALLASLLDRSKLDLEDFGRKLIAWFERGYLAVDGNVFDYGATTAEAIGNLRNGTPADKAGPARGSANGNGSLMRVLPLALWYRGSDEELVADAQRQSLVTHGHIRSQVCCALYCLWARRVMHQVSDPWASATAALRGLYPKASPEHHELEDIIRPDEFPKATGKGYVVDCLWSARWAVEQGSYEQVVKAAIILGQDTDTTACVAGGIAGLRDGVSAIPERWRISLRGQEMVRPLLEGLLKAWKVA